MKSRPSSVRKVDAHAKFDAFELGIALDGILEWSAREAFSRPVPMNTSSEGFLMVKSPSLSLCQRADDADTFSVNGKGGFGGSVAIHRDIAS